MNSHLQCFLKEPFIQRKRWCFHL